MSRLFDDGDSEYLEVDSAPISAGFPLTLACWFYSDDLTIEQMLIQICEKGATNNYVRINLAGQVGGDPIYAASRNTGWTGANTSSGYSANTWHHACGVFSASNARAAFIDGGSKGTDNGNQSPDAQDRTSIGVAGDSSRDSYMSGRIAEVGVWTVALSDAEVALLALGFSPLLVRPESLVFYDPLIRGMGDVIGGLILADNNGSVVAVHPQIIYPAPPFFVATPTAAVVAGHPIMKRWGGIPYMEPRGRGVW